MIFTGSNSNKRLGIVGTMEEGILAIEKATVTMGEGVDVKRDNILSHICILDMARCYL